MILKLKKPYCHVKQFQGWWNEMLYLTLRPFDRLRVLRVKKWKFI